MAVTIHAVYSELKALRKEMDMLMHVLVPEEKVSQTELKELKAIEREMHRGKRIRFS